jgi:hypothetical protein
MVSDRTIRRDRLADRRGSALVITMLLLVILTAIGIYAFSISTTEMNISLNSRVGMITRNVVEAGAFYGIDAVPTTFDNTAPAVLTLAVSTGMTATYSVTSAQVGPLTIQPGYGVNYRFADFEVASTVSGNNAPTGFTTSAQVDALVNYGPIPAGTSY